MSADKFHSVDFIVGVVGRGGGARRRLPPIFHPPQWKIDGIGDGDPARCDRSRLHSSRWARMSGGDTRVMFIAQ